MEILSRQHHVAYLCLLRVLIAIGWVIGHVDESLVWKGIGCLAAFFLLMGWHAKVMVLLLLLLDLIACFLSPQPALYVALHPMMLVMPLMFCTPMDTRFALDHARLLLDLEVSWSRKDRTWLMWCWVAVVSGLVYLRLVTYVPVVVQVWFLAVGLVVIGLAEVITLDHRKQESLIYYDEECVFCKKGVYILASALGIPKKNVLPAQRDQHMFDLMQTHHSWVVAFRNETYFGYEAFLVVLSQSPVFFWLRPLFALRPMVIVGQHIYLWVSHHRSWMGKCLRWVVFLKKPSVLHKSQSGFKFAVVMVVIAMGAIIEALSL